jgi:hypothetical protein
LDTEKANQYAQRKPIVFEYTFLIDEGLRTFSLKLDRKTLALQQERKDPPPAWADLGCSKCENCPLSEDTHPHCPIAYNIVELVDFFGHAVSYKEVDVRISSDERSYVKHTTMSEALSSLFGVYKVTSGCPIMDRLRPMVRFHLQMASSEETTFRAIAMYLVAQYFKAQRGGTPDWDLKGLPGIYKEVHTVNRDFADRIRIAVDSDAGPNAIIRLDTFASIILMSLDNNTRGNLEALFESYYSDDSDE